MEPSSTSEIQKNIRYYNHNSWEIKHSIGTKSKHNMKINIQIFKEDKDNVPVTFYTFILKALSRVKKKPQKSVSHNLQQLLQFP